MRRLTAKQSNVLQFISDYIDDEGYPPTRNEIAEHFGWRSPNAAQMHLEYLRDKGYITIKPGISRGLKVIKHETLYSCQRGQLSPPD